MDDTEILCAACKRVLDERPDEASRPPCPDCGSTNREFNVALSLNVEARDSIRAIGKRPGFGKLFDTFSGSQFGVAAQRWFRKVRLVDRQNDRYLERVWDPESGEIIHECEEPLSQHAGHGSAKPKKPSGEG